MASPSQAARRGDKRKGASPLSLEQIAREQQQRRRQRLASEALGEDSGAARALAPAAAAPAAEAPVTVAFGPVAQDLSKLQVELGKKRLEGLRPDVAVADKWATPAAEGGVSVIVASPRSSAEEIAASVGLRSLEGKLVLRFDSLMARLVSSESLRAARERGWWLEAAHELEWRRLEPVCAPLAAPARVSPTVSSSSRSLPEPAGHAPAHPETGSERATDADADAARRSSRSLPAPAGHAPAHGETGSERVTNADAARRSDGTASSSPANLNAHITDILERLERATRAQPGAQNKARRDAYALAAAKLKLLPFKVDFAEQLRGEPGFGDNMRKHVREILATGTDVRLETLEHGGCAAESELREVHGIGPHKAKELVRLGVSGVADLVSDSGELTALARDPRLELGPMILTALRYHRDSLVRIPRDELTEVLARVDGAARELWPGTPVEVCLVGSYRRGAEDSGDVDLLIAPLDDNDDIPPLRELVERLTRDRLVLATLGATWESGRARPAATDTEMDMSEEDTEGMAFFKGYLRLSPQLPCRRIDIWTCTRTAWPFALAQLTGDTSYNRSIKAYCKFNDLTYSFTGIFWVVRSGTGTRQAKAAHSLCKAKTEQDVFQFLGLPFLEPWERNSKRFPQLSFKPLPWHGDPEVSRVLAQRAAAGERTPRHRAALYSAY
jgi:DNA polymerase lambda